MTLVMLGDFLSSGPLGLVNGPVQTPFAHEAVLCHNPPAAASHPAAEYQRPEQVEAKARAGAHTDMDGAAGQHIRHGQILRQAERFS
jgi:hypothetical protein